MIPLIYRHGNPHGYFCASTTGLLLPSIVDED